MGDNSLVDVLRTAAREELVRALGPGCGKRRRLVVDRALFDSRGTHVRAFELFADISLLRQALGWPAVQSDQTKRDESAQAEAQVVVPLWPGIEESVGAQDEDGDEDGDELSLLLGLESGSIDPVFVVRPGRLDVARTVAEVVKRLREKHSTLNARVLTMNCDSAVVEHVLEEEEVLDCVSLDSLRLGFLPIDSDIVTLDIPSVFREVLLEGNNINVRVVMDSILALEKILGFRVTRVSAAGRVAQLGSEILQGVLTERGCIRTAQEVTQYRSFDNGKIFSKLTQSTEEAPQPAPNECHLILVDRAVDLVTPLLTQWTYEGLLDEMFEMSNTVLDIDVHRLESETAAMISSALSGSSRPSGDIRWKLGSWDTIFAKLRDLNFWAAANVLGNVASTVRDYYNARPSREDAETKQVKDYVENLHIYNADHKSVSVHTALAAEISTRTFENPDFKRKYELERELIEGGSPSTKRLYISDCIARKDPLRMILRLCSLWSVTHGGIESGKYDFLRGEILSSYGIEHLPFLSNLRGAGLFHRSDSNQVPPSLGDYLVGSAAHPRTGSGSMLSQFSWNFTRVALKLVSQYDPDQAPDGDLMAPYSGYYPLAVKLVETALSSRGWSSLPFGGSGQAVVPAYQSLADRSIARNDGSEGPASRKTIFVVFIGGSTRAEISVLRRLAKQRSHDGEEFLFGTTAMMTGDTFMRSMMDD